MVRLIFHPEAKEELRKSAARYEEKRPGLGRDFFNEVRGIAAKIRQNPDWMLPERNALPGSPAVADAAHTADASYHQDRGG